MNITDIFNNFENNYHSKKNKLGEISKFWINNKHFWFNSNNLISNEIKEKLSNFKTNLDYKLSSDNTLSLDKIIYFDQIVKHLDYDNEKIKKSYNFALNQSLHGIKMKLDLNFCPEGRCFYLLALRHSNNIEHIYFSIRRIYQYIEESSDIPNIYLTFLKLYIKKYDKLKNSYDDIQIISWNKINILSNKYENVKFIENDFIKKLKLNLINIPCKMVIFCDGEVSSMTLIFILSNLFPNRVEVANICLNSKNNYLESNLIAKYCDILNIPFKCRKIREIKKTNYLKDFYKKYIDQITRKLLLSYNYDNEWDIIDNYGIFLGENKSNAMNNIINNITEKKNLNNLKSLDYKTIIDDFTFYKPFYNFDLKEIVNYADNFKIPYFKNINNENKIKNIIIKYDKSFLSGLDNLSNYLKKLTIDLEK